MVATVGSISIDLITNAAKFATGFRSAATTVDRESARMSRSIGNADRAAASFIRNSVAGLAAGLGTREIARYADAWTEAGNKIRAAGEVAGRQGRSIEELNDLATKTRSGLEDTVDLYAKLLRATGQVAKSEEEVARATEIVNKAFKAGGAAASEQAAGILQLSQALGSGLLQGDELRSIRENAPLLAKAIADEFGVTIAGLKDLGSEGVLTSDRIFKAILNAQKDIDDAFAQTQATLGENLTLLKNASIELIGVLDQATGASAGLARDMSNLAAEIRAAGQASQDFADSGSLDDLLRIFGLSLKEGAALDQIRDFYTAWRDQSGRTTEAIKADIAAVEERIAAIRDNAAAGGLFPELALQRDQMELQALQDELKKVELAALSAANNGGGALASLADSAIAAMNKATGGAAGLPNVARYGLETADNTERTADSIERLNSSLPDYLHSLGTDIGGYFDNTFQSVNELLQRGFQVHYATIADAVRTGIVSGMQTGERNRYTSESYLLGQGIEYIDRQIAQLQVLSRTTGSLASDSISQKIAGLESKKLSYAGMFAEGGSFVAPGNQTGDTTRLVMDVNGGERVTVSPKGSERPVNINYYAAPGENDRTSRQNARMLGMEISRELARA